MASIEWKVDQMFVKPTVGELENVVHQLHWKCIAKEGETQQHTYGSVDLVLDGENGVESFIPYGDLSHDQAVQWVKNALGEQVVNRNEEQALQNLLKVLNPQSVSLDLPW